MESYETLKCSSFSWVRSDKARIYLESQNLNETIMIPDLSIDHERMARRVRIDLLQLGLHPVNW